jgi:hypothetical protein
VRGDAVDLAHADYFQDPGFSEWAVLAVRPGTATISAGGNRSAPAKNGAPTSRSAS